MKKSKIWIVGLIVLLMASGLVFMGCGSCDGCSASNTGATVNCGDSGCAVYQWSQRWQQGDRDSNLPQCNC